MTDVLSNDEIAALVEAARGGQMPATKAPTHERRARRVRGVDFTRPTKFTQDQQRRLRRGHESFCRAVSTQLSAELRIPVELEVINVDQQTWAAALGEIPHQSLYAVVGTSSGGRVLASLEQSAAMHTIERLLGSTSGSAVIERELTEIELALVNRIFTTIVTQLSRSWEELVGLTLTLAAVESQQSNIQLVPFSEPTLAITIEVRIDRLSSTLTLLLPHRSIESTLEKLSSGHYGDSIDLVADAAVEEAVRSSLRNVDVEVRAEIGSCALTIDEVLALQPGDVIELGSAAAGGTLYAAKVPIHRMKPGRSGKRRAIEIVGRIEPR